MKKMAVLIVTLFVLMFLSIALADEIKINMKNFPDVNFRRCVKEQADTNGDGYLSDDEIKSLSTLDCSSRKIRDLTGVEYFSALTVLKCPKNKLTVLDVCSNKNLTTLVCFDNKLTKLDVTKNKKLKMLECWNNPLKKLDVSKNKKLEYLGCDNTQLTELDVSENIKLVFLNCGQNLLKKLDVSKNSKLQYLWCNNNLLEQLDVSSNTLIEELYCLNNKLKTLKLGVKKCLRQLECTNNKLKTLDIRNSILVKLVKSKPRTEWYMEDFFGGRWCSGWEEIDNTQTVTQYLILDKDVRVISQ